MPGIGNATGVGIDGPTPAVGGWTPDEMTSGLIWWNASDSDDYTESSGSVTDVVNKFGDTEFDVQQLTALNQPSTGGSINSVDAFSFGSVNLENLAKTTTALDALDGNGDLLCSCVFKPANTSARRYVTYNDTLFRLSNDGLQDRAHGNDIMTLTRGTAATIVTMRMNDTTNELWQDGAAETPVTFADEAAANASSVVLGSNNGGAKMEGDWGELIMYRDPDERSDVESYLADKWGVTLP